MKWSSFKMPIVARVFIRFREVMLESLPIKAIRHGLFHMGNLGKPFDITRAQDSIAFWALVIVFSMLSAGAICVAIAKKLPNA